MRRNIRVFLLLRQFLQTVKNDPAPPVEPADDPDDQAPLDSTPSLDLPLSWQQLFMAPRFEEKEHVDLSQRCGHTHHKHTHTHTHTQHTHTYTHSTHTQTHTRTHSTQDTHT